MGPLLSFYSLSRKTGFQDQSKSSEHRISQQPIKWNGAPAGTTSTTARPTITLLPWGHYPQLSTTLERYGVYAVCLCSYVVECVPGGPNAEVVF